MLFLYSRGHHTFSYFDAVWFGAVAIAIMFVLVFSRKAIVRRKLKKAPLLRLSEFRNGDVAKIVGRVEFVGEPLEAPLSGRECAWYEIFISEKSGKTSRTLVDEEKKTSFVLRDGDRVAVINSPKIKSYIVRDVEYTSGFLNDATQRLEACLKRHGHKSESWLGLNKSITYNEGILERNEAVAVLGQGVWRDAESLNLPAHYGMVLLLTAPEEGTVYLSDDEKAVATEWENTK